jgi:hypothetical protein
MDEVKVVVAHSERVTLRVGDMFLKVDADQARIDVEVETMALAPVPTPEVRASRAPIRPSAVMARARRAAVSSSSPAKTTSAGTAGR